MPGKKYLKKKTKAIALFSFVIVRVCSFFL